MGTKSRGTVVYVAGASKEIERAERMIEKLRALGLGVSIAVDWPKRFREERAKHDATRDVDVPVATMREIYDEEIEGARMAEVFVLLHPPKASDTTVAWAELSAARIGKDGFRPTVIVSGWDGTSSLDGTEPDLHPIATAFASAVLEKDAEVITWLAGYMAARRAA